MKPYRICLLDRDGRISLSFHLAFQDDLSALAECETASPKELVEIWDQERLVARVDPENAPVSVQDPIYL